ncbi:MAG: hypothetical protein KDD94_11985 [Calditrichaeota bacterium]|nr:hypothetical protein [Calditrichota bacterium]
MKICIYLTLLIMISCASQTEDQALTKLDQAWQQFELRHYSAAIDLFKQVITESKNLEASVGLGYSYMFLSDYFNSTLILTQAYSDYGNKADLLAALVLVLNAEGQDLTTSNLFADELLIVDPQWKFGHQLNLTVNDIYLVQAQNYYLLGDFVKSIEMIQLLDSTFNADISTEAGKLELGEQIDNMNPGL